MTITLNGTTGITTPEITTDSGASLTSRVAKTGDTMTGALRFATGTDGISATNSSGLTSRILIGHQSDTVYMGAIDGNFAGGVIIRTNASDSLIIDNSGRVTMPYQPRFNACNGSMANAGSIVTLDFTAVLHNNGGHYNTSNYRFTAPIAGTYRFSFSLMTYSGWWSRCQFAKNGSVIGSQFYASSYGNYSRNCGEIILALSAGDYIEVKRNVQSESGEGVHSDYRHFSGELIG